MSEGTAGQLFKCYPFRYYEVGCQTVTYLYQRLIEVPSNSDWVLVAEVGAPGLGL